MASNPVWHPLAPLGLGEKTCTRLRSLKKQTKWNHLEFSSIVIPILAHYMKL